MKRILLSLLLAWVALAPAVAGSCATDCEARIVKTATNADTESANAHPDCHGTSETQHDPADDQPHDSGMMSACAFAAAASICAPSFCSPLSEIETVHMPAPQSAPASTPPSRPDKPPQR